MRGFLLSLSAIASFALPLTASAQAQSAYSEEGFRAYLPYLRSQALAAGVSQATADRIFPQLNFSRRTLELDRDQVAGVGGGTLIPPFEPYRQKHVTPTMIARGSQRYSAWRQQLDYIGQRYGVTPSIMVAIWGHETS